ncbi:coiled-coil domain-containing protein R3HCC1L isoform X1 [Osmerus eperlanus]|uniref:coiled-coil domain-containing protein R3HCC1L isoform X1 n=1 Tax=Osmerus eperlanus TaxID=29151 RepID=UPI002E0EFD79
MEGEQPEGDSVQSQTPTSRSKKPEKNRQGASGQSGPKDKPQSQGEAKPKPRPRYTDKARKNAKNKKDKAGKGGEEGKIPESESQSEERLQEGEGPQPDGQPPTTNEGADVEAGSNLEVDNQGNGALEEEEEEEEEEEDSWDTLFNDDGECLDPHVVEELSGRAGRKKASAQEARCDRGGEGAQDGDVDLSEDELAHIVEIYDFPAGFKTEDLLKSFQAYQQRGFDIQWIDESHALALFSHPVTAREALRTKHPLLKVRSLAKASVTTRAKARSCSDYLLPSKERPPTSAALARRLVIGALGVKSNQTQEGREAEKKKLQEAREQKRLAAKQRDDAWEGN